MEEYIDILIERVRIIKNWKEYMPMIAKVIKKSSTRFTNLYIWKYN
jgi:hypothetical protein